MEAPRLIGVLHLPPLPGSPGAAHLPPVHALAQAAEQAVSEARKLEKAGFQGLILENFGDVPFYRDRVPAETVAAMSMLAGAIRQATPLPLGINVLRNDAFAALAIAACSGSDFIRVNVLSGVAATDQGVIEGQAAALLRERARLGAPVEILADAHVKHARSLSSDSIALAIEEIAGRGGATGVIITGATTGRSVDSQVLVEAGAASRHCGVPLYIGSGATPETLQELLTHAHGVIVGSALRQHGQAGAPLDPARIRSLMRAFAKVKRPSAARRRKAPSRSR
jgi:membrane complex biogenesis BtpA family protein